MKTYAELAKIRISALTTLSAAAGYLAAGGFSVPGLLFLSAAVFLTAAGSCALNQYMERDIDARMKRTRDRPIPSGRLEPSKALCFALTLSIAGPALLLLRFGVFPAALGTLAAVWYCGVYTGLKRVTAFAAVPGALVGSLAPAIGWTARGGGILDTPNLALMFFFFMWQIPHFWLHLIDDPEDYGRSGLPLLTDTFSTGQIRRITFMWTMAALCSALILPAAGLIRNPFLFGILFSASLYIGVKSVIILGNRETAPVFARVNLLALIVIAGVSAEKIIKASPWAL